jgi:hypothetical protein
MDRSAQNPQTGSVAGVAYRDPSLFAAPSSENRREGRIVCHGQVRLSIGPQDLFAELADVSNNGFRVVHMHPELQPGRNVSFQHRFFVGQAEVVWTQSVAGRLQSGLRVLRV